MTAMDMEVISSISVEGIHATSLYLLLVPFVFLCLGHPTAPDDTYLQPSLCPVSSGLAEIPLLSYAN